MALSVEEKRARERERKARYRARQRDAAQLESLPRIGPGGRDGGGTGGGTEGQRLSNVAAARVFLDGLTIPASSQPRAALLLTLAADLDSGAVAQRSSIAQRYDETIEKLVAAAKPVERDELDELRREFYTGGVGGIDDDPEASQRRGGRKKA